MNFSSSFSSSSFKLLHFMKIFMNEFLSLSLSRSWEICFFHIYYTAFVVRSSECDIEKEKKIKWKEKKVKEIKKQTRSDWFATIMYTFTGLYLPTVGGREVIAISLMNYNWKIPSSIGESFFHHKHIIKIKSINNFLFFFRAAAAALKWLSASSKHHHDGANESSIKIWDILIELKIERNWREEKKL